MASPNRTELAGIGEVNEAYVGGEESNGKRGRCTVGKSLVAIGVELLKGKIKLGENE